ncbi:MAG: type I methionyl aminopeptidase, partial [Chloroflexi bacterium]|nr:type I methionyl aminopeptidase [Chloroflexota bacterium]
MGIIIKSSGEIAIMRRAGTAAYRVLDTLAKEVRPGMKTKELDVICVQELARRGAKASFKGYRGFPASLCVSLNDEVVHGIPGDRVIREGDIVSLDVGTICDGFQGDVALTVGVGDIGPVAKRLLQVTRDSLLAGIAAARAGRRLGDVSYSIQTYVESRGFAVVREYTGHGIGRQMHEEPQIANFGLPGQGPILRKGMTLAIEPMVNA